jgi:hypothetical protein
MTFGGVSISNLLEVANRAPQAKAGKRCLIGAAMQIHTSLNSRRLGVQHFRVRAGLVLVAVAGNAEVVVGLRSSFLGDEHAFPRSADRSISAEIRRRLTTAVFRPMRNW